MASTNILDLKKQDIENERTRVSETIKLQKFSNTLNSFGRVFWGVTGGMLLFGGMPVAGIAFLSTAIANHLNLNNRGKIEKNKLEMLKKEEEHIQKVKDNPIDGSREITAKRVRKVNELSARKETANKNRKNAEFLSGLSTLFQWGALAATLTIPGAGWLSAVALVAKYFSGEKKIETAKEDDMLALRLNNLNLDLELTRAKAPTPRAAGETKCEVVETTKENKKVVEKAPYSLEDEMLVDKYVESLAGIGEEEKVKTFIK